MPDILSSVDWPNTARVAVLMGIAVATGCLLWKKLTAPAYTAVIGGLALLWVVCNVDLKGASRIVVAGFEIDRRVEMAEKAIDRLEKLEASAQQMANTMQELIGQMHKLEAHQRPRTLTADQRRTLIQRLKDGPKGPFSFGGVAEPEADSYSNELEDVLKEAGWTVWTGGGWRPAGLDETYGPASLLGRVGLVINVGRAELAPHGTFLRQTLQAVGVDVGMQADLPMPDTLVGLVVGLKPWLHNREMSQQEQQP